MPEGNIFGSESSDEFSIEIGDNSIGVFKRFEYLSLPFSITDNRGKFRELLRNTRKNGTSFKEEIEKDSSAQQAVDTILKRMESSPLFSKQTLDLLLSESYVNDNILAGIEVGKRLEDFAAKVVVFWEHLADLYCIEGLVGGGGERNPFRQPESSSFVAGTLDSVETILPILKKRMDEKSWKETCLKLSSIIGRSYKQIDRAVDVLGVVFGKDREFSDGELMGALESVNQLATATLETNTDVGKFYNSFIRFHNWMPLALKEGGPEGDTYDSICAPAKDAVRLLEEGSEIAGALSSVTDATSPKGLAVAMLIDEGKIGSRKKLVRKVRNLENRLQERLTAARTKFSIFGLNDPVFYTGLVGGKWKGLKLLYDVKEALGMNYKVPNGFVISSIEINRILRENGVIDMLDADSFSLDENRRLEIIRKMDKIKFMDNLSALVSGLGNELIARSSMYGEDSSSNFSGTYDSIRCRSETVNDAVKKVLQSYFSKEAVKSREEVGLAHVPGISVIVQEYIEGIGGLIHLTEGVYSLSFAKTPRRAVTGRGTHRTSENIDKVVAGTPLEVVGEDLHKLHEVFGNLDIESVIDRDRKVYFVQLRPKYRIPERADIEVDAERLIVNSMDDLQETKLDRKRIVRMNFLGKENIMNQEEKIMEFIRKNRSYILAVEGSMPSVAHIPNKIEGHFRIPYLNRDDKK